MVQPSHNLKSLTFARHALLSIINQFSVEDLNKIPEGYNNNLIWNFAHCIVSTQFMCYGSTGNPVGISKELTEKYKRGSKPDSEAPATEEEINYWKELALSSVKQIEADANSGILSTYHSWSIGKHYSVDSLEDALEFCHFHEGSHYGYMLALKRFL